MTVTFEILNERADFRHFARVPQTVSGHQILHEAFCSRTANKALRTLRRHGFNYKWTKDSIVLQAVAPEASTEAAPATGYAESVTNL
jgi:hypothetical protein